jgi:hypothetical protein
VLLASYSAVPTNYHVKCLKRLLRYLLSHAHDTIHIGIDPNFSRTGIQLACFTDADWAADRVSRRSMTGFFLYLSGNLLTSNCKYHPTQCFSSMEAEYMGEATAAKTISSVINLIKALMPFFAIALPVALFGDNNAALKFAECHSVNDRTKHIDLRHHYLIGMVDAGLITMNYVCTDDNIADILTKPLNELSFVKFKGFVAGHAQPHVLDLVRKLKVLNEIRHLKI